jgi:hypothetical protein
MPFFNSYHNLEMFSEALFWNLNEESIEFKFLPSTGSGNTAVFESTNFFEQNRIDKLQGFLVQILCILYTNFLELIMLEKLILMIL